MHERIKMVRMESNLTSKEFGSRIGVKRSAMSTIESGKSNPSDQTVLFICKEFGINEHWLRTGEGEMHSEPIYGRGLMRFAKELMNAEDELSKAKRELVLMLARLSPEEWELIVKFLNMRKGQ